MLVPREGQTVRGRKEKKGPERKSRERKHLFYYLLVLGIFKALERQKEHKGEPIDEDDG